MKKQMKYILMGCCLLMVVDFSSSTSLAQSMFLPDDPNQNPFYDLEIDFLAQSMSLSSSDNTGRSLIQSRNGFVNELEESTRDDQLESQGDIDLITFVGLLGNGPTTINLLGQIMVISSKKDFSFRSNMPPNSTFNYVKYPDSFRATLIQLANEAYNAFLSAHSNMNEIQLNMLQIPGHVKTALKLLATAPLPLLEKLLPLSLNNIERIGIECSDLSTTTHNRFSDVQLLIGEINELTGYSSGVTDQKLAETRIELNKTEAAKNALKDKEILIKQRYEEQAANVRKAQRDFDKALKEIPTGLNAMVKQALGAAFDIVLTAVATEYCLGGAIKNCMPEKVGANANKNAIEKANLALASLKSAEEQYHKTFIELMDHYDDLKQVMIQLTSLDMTKIDFEQLIPIFQNAIRYLSEIRVHWGKLIDFFNTLRIRVQIVVKNSFAKFIDWMKSTQGMDKDFLTQEIRAYYLDMLKDDVIGIHRESHLLYIISKTYYDVSTENMMDQLASLAKMVVASSDEQRNTLKNQLMQDTQAVQFKVSQLAIQRKNQYEKANLKRQQEIEQFLLQISIQSIEQSVGRRRKRQQLFLS